MCRKAIIQSGEGRGRSSEPTLKAGGAGLEASQVVAG